MFLLRFKLHFSFSYIAYIINITSVAWINNIPLVFLVIFFILLLSILPISSPLLTLLFSNMIYTTYINHASISRTMLKVLILCF